jgi:hypothetical protein
MKGIPPIQSEINKKSSAEEPHKGRSNLTMKAREQTSESSTSPFSADRIPMEFSAKVSNGSSVKGA